MSATNVFLQSDAVQVLTDGAGYTPEGILQQAISKVVSLPHLNCVVAGRGPALVPAFMSTALGASSNRYDGMKTLAPEIIEFSSDLFQSTLEACRAGIEFDVIVAGISETTGPDAFLICNHARYGKPPFELIQLGDINLLPGDAGIHDAWLATIPDGAGADDLDPETHGLSALECQRRFGAKASAVDGLPRVGGFAQLTTITKAGITTKILKRWGDRIGHPVGEAA